MSYLAPARPRPAGPSAALALGLAGLLAFAGLVGAGCSANGGAAPPTSEPSAEPSGGEPALVLTPVAVVPMTGAGRLEGQTVVVRGDRIVALGPAAEVAVPAGATVVDGTGRTLVPGLIDMHLHLPPDPGEPGGPARRALALLVANGVTTARSLSGHPAQLALRAKVDAGELLGPTLYLAAPAIHQGNTATPEAAREVVRAAREAGYDLVKSHHLEDPEVWRAVQEEAARLGLPVSGHVANGVGLERAIEAGQQIEHLDGFVAALLPPESPARRGPWGQIPPAAVLEQVEADRLPALARRMAEEEIWNTPTLALFERIADLETPAEALAERPEMRYVPAEALEAWAAQRAGLAASGLLDGVSAPFVELRRSIVAALHRAGAPLLAGSDTPQAFLLTGFGLHDELAALAAAGLPPEAALATATREPARYLAAQPRGGSATGRPVDFGTIAPGRRADLVLLGADPTADVAATRRIEGVVLRGRWLDRAALDRLLAEAERSAGAAEAGSPG